MEIHDTVLSQQTASTDSAASTAPTASAASEAVVVSLAKLKNVNRIRSSSCACTRFKYSWNSFQLCATAVSKVILHKWAIFYGTEMKNWTVLGPIGNTEKKIGSIMSNFWSHFLYVFRGIFFFFLFFKYCSIWAKKFHKRMLEKIFKKFLKIW